MVVKKEKFKKSEAFKSKYFSCGRIGHKTTNCKVKKKKYGGDFFNSEEKKKKGGKDKIFKKESKDKSSQKKRSENPILLMIDICLICKDDIIWYLDSRAIRHVTLHKNRFTNEKLLPKGQTIFVKHNHECQIKGIDNFLILLNNGVFKKITNAFHVPRMAKNLLLAQEFRKIDFEIHLRQDIYIEDKYGKRLTHLEEINGFFKISKNS